MKIVFICTGNTCRSPMCEGYFKKLCSEHQCNDIIVSSAGTAAFPGGSASVNSIAVMAAEGVDLSSFRSRALTPELIDEADLLICMTSNHRRAIGQAKPAALKKTCLLLDFDNRNRNGDITDPFGGSRELYSLCFSDMKPALENLFKKTILEKPSELPQCGI